MKVVTAATSCLAALFAVLLVACNSKRTGEISGLGRSGQHRCRRVSVRLSAYDISIWSAQQQTNVAAPDAEHAPMGQMIRMRSYPAVDNHCCAAPNADTLYTEAWLDVSKEPWVLEHS